MLEYRYMSDTLDKIAVEDCWRLSLENLGKKILDGKDGRFVIFNGLTPILGSFRSEDDFLNISFNKNSREHTQTIMLAESEAVFGTRPYLICSRCDSRRNDLYLRPDSYSFVCRDCANLYYYSTRQNRRTVHGNLFYQHNQCMKLMTLEPLVKRISYNGKLTRRASQVIQLSKKIHCQSQFI